MRFKIEYLSEELLVCGSMFPTGVSTLEAAIEAATKGKRAKQSAGIRIRDADEGGQVVWGQRLDQVHDQLTGSDEATDAHPKAA